MRTNTYVHTYMYGWVCYNERIYNEKLLSIKSGCYNECGVILSADVSRACAGRVGPCGLH